MVECGLFVGPDDILWVRWMCLKVWFSRINFGVHNSLPDGINDRSMLKDAILLF